MIVDENGHTNRGYGHTPYNKVDSPYLFDNQHYATNNIKDLFPEHFGTIPRDDSFAQFEEYPINQEHMNVLYTVNKYSDELANGDSADDKEL